MNSIFHNVALNLTANCGVLYFHANHMANFHYTAKIIKTKSVTQDL